MLISQLSKHLDVAVHFVLMSRIHQGGLIGDKFRFVSFKKGLIEGFPTEGCAGFDDFLEGAIFAFAVHD